MGTRAKHHRFGVMTALAAALLALLLAPAATAATLQTGWKDVAKTGLSGVAFAVTQRPTGGYYAYYMGMAEGMTAAGSGDGADWTRLKGFVPPFPDPYMLMISNPWVFVTTGGRYRMIYEQQDMSGNRRLYSAVSDDGLSFQNEGLVMAGQDEDIPEGDGSKDGGTVFLSVPAGLRLPDGSLRMYFVSAGDRIRSAVSTDEGLTWQRDVGVRLLDAVDPSLVALPGGGYRLFYVDWSRPFRTKRAGYADSADGLEFTRQDWLASTDSGVLVDPELLPTAAGLGETALFFSFGADMENIDIFRAIAPTGYSDELYPLVSP